MGWPPIGPDDVGDLRRARAARRCSAPAGDPTVLAHCGLHLLQAAQGVRLGHGDAASPRRRPTPTTSGVVIAAGIAHLHCGNLDEALAYFHRAIRLAPERPEAHSSLTGIAHAHMRARRPCRGARLGRTRARAEPERSTRPLDARRRQRPPRPHGRGPPLSRRAPPAGARGHRRQHPRRQLRQGPEPHRADPRRPAPRRLPEACARAYARAFGIRNFSPPAEGH